MKNTGRNREQTLVEAVRVAQKRQFGLTAVKVEFEAKFNRSRVQLGCDHCYRGSMRCEACGGDGRIYDSLRSTNIRCNTCQETGRVDCTHCDTSKRPNWNDLDNVHDHILQKLVRHGLAEKLPRGEYYSGTKKYRPIHPLAFSYVYNDSTVDTEQTLTLALDKPENVLLLPKLVKAFYSLKDAIGQGIDVSTAGMHMALMNDPEWKYPSHELRQMVHYRNFRKSIILLMPALYFLGSSNEKSRSLEYRRPSVGCEDMNHDDGHTSAINYVSGALEFRVFETCYDNPEAILDNMMVMLNCLRFWTKKYTRNYLAKIANDVPFGIEEGEDLKRLYVTREHIDLLNRGLRMTKPPYYTVSEVKKQRGFTYTKIDANNFAKEVQKEIEKEYQAYEKRFHWQLVTTRNSYINTFIESKLNGTDIPDPGDKKLIEEAEKYADGQCNVRRKNKKQLDKFQEENSERLGKAGDYRLCAG